MKVFLSSEVQRILVGRRLEPDPSGDGGGLHGRDVVIERQEHDLAFL